jgi:hypothetical protein
MSVAGPWVCEATRVRETPVIVEPAGMAERSKRSTPRRRAPWELRPAKKLGPAPLEVAPVMLSKSVLSREAWREMVSAPAEARERAAPAMAGRARERIVKFSGESVLEYTPRCGVSQR